jgi:hypothetical protein
MGHAGDDEAQGAPGAARTRLSVRSKPMTRPRRHRSPYEAPSPPSSALRARSMLAMFTQAMRGRPPPRRGR